MEKLRHLLVLGTLLAVILWTSSSSVVSFQKCTCIGHNPAIIQNISCSARPVSWSNKVLNIRFWVTKEIHDVFIHGVLYQRSVVNFRPFLVNVTENFCNFVEKNRAGFYLRMIAPIYKPYSNINHSCPYSGLINVKEMPLNLNANINKLARIWPEGVYRVDLLVTEGRNDPLLTIQVFFELK